jgi:hypothetical protein
VNADLAGERVGGAAQVGHRRDPFDPESRRLMKLTTIFLDPASHAIPEGALARNVTTLGLSGDPMAPGAIAYVFMIAVFAVAIWYLIDLGILKGTTGPNQYGPDPLGAR